MTTPPIPEVAPLCVPAFFAPRLAALDPSLALDDGQREALGAFLARLLAVNESMNLTAVREPDAAWEKHVLDALSIARLLPQGARVVDVGSGCGVPGIPLAIARPDLEVTLVESIQKKAAFLEAVARAGGLTRVHVRAGRAEALPELRGAFDVVVARAVARLPQLLEWTLPLVKKGGSFVFIKGRQAELEVAEAKKLLARAKLVVEPLVETPTGVIVVIRGAWLARASAPEG
jgi:16S rRNA (guanine(527)-N(7))-methyltransferase RsmG